MKSYRFVVSGKVQGVWYRRTILTKALSLNLKGYVKNLEDSSVEVCVMLDDKNHHKFKDILIEGSPASIVENITEEVIDETFDSFDIKY